MIAFAQFGKFTRSRPANEKQNAGALALSFVYAERGRSSFSAGWNRHYELTGTRHRNQIRRVKTKEDHAGCKFRPIQHALLVYGRHWHYRILVTNPTYLRAVRSNRNRIFNQSCDI